jgi:hypothetical protein
VVALAALIGLVVWLVVESGGGSSPAPVTNNGPVAVSESGLKTLAQAVGQPIYWVGAQRSTLYELTRTSSRVYLRYLPRGAKVGDPRPLLTVGTYALRNAYAVTKAGSKGPGKTVFKVPGGGIGVVNKAKPTSVYVAFPGVDFQVELYDPNARVVRKLAASGSVQPVAGTAQSRGPVAVSRKELRTLAASVGHAVYWAGPRARTTYELTQTSDGRTYIRYLPRGVSVGDKKARLTVATYPLADAFTALQATAKEPGNVTIKLARGGIAVYSKQLPTNIHVAYPGEDVQVEVYGPSANVLRRLVAGGQVVPIG